MKTQAHQAPREVRAPIKKRIAASIRNKIFVGLLLTAPILATVWIVNFLLKLLTSWFPKRMVPVLGDLYSGYLVRLLVLIAILLFFYLLGALAHYFFGKRIYQFADSLFSRIPLVKTIYVFVRQVCEWVARSRSAMFQSVVLVEYPRRGIYALAFVTSETSPVLGARIAGPGRPPAPCKNVFLPTTPNPTSGFFLVVPEEDLIPTDIDVADAVNLIISGGVIFPKGREEKRAKSSLLEMIDSLVAENPDGAPPAAKNPDESR